MLGFKYNTLVLMGDYSYKPIQEVQPEEEVISYDEEQHEFKKQIVVATLSDICDLVVRYTFSNGTIVEGCEHTKFLTPSGYIENIDIGQDVITLDGVATLINKQDEEPQQVYDLDIEDIDNFVVCNIVVHNPPTTKVTHKANKDSTSTYAGAAYIWSKASSSASWAYKGEWKSNYITVSNVGTSVILGVSSSSSAYTSIPNVEISLSSTYIPQPTYTYNSDGSITIASNLTTTSHTENHSVKINAVSANLPVYSGSMRIKKAYLGSTEIRAIYIGSNKIF